MKIANVGSTAPGNIWTTAEFLHFLLWHETYHTGQTELLRQLTGVNDKVI